MKVRISNGRLEGTVDSATWTKISKHQLSRDSNPAIIEFNLMLDRDPRRPFDTDYMRCLAVDAIGIKNGASFWTASKFS